MSDFTVKIIEPEELYNFQAIIEENLEKTKGIWGNHVTKDFLFTLLENGHAQHWMVLEKNKKKPSYSFMTQVTEESVIVFWGFGKLTDKILTACDECLQIFGRMYGAKKIEIHGRIGWERRLAKWGFKVQKIILEKEIEDKGRLN